LTLFNRAKLFIASLILLVAGLIALFLAFGWDLSSQINGIVQFFLLHRIESALLGIILLIPGISLLYLTLEQEKEFNIIQDTPLGQIRINLKAIETLVVRVAKEVKGIKDVDAHIYGAPEGVEILLSVVVTPEMAIPEISQEVQRRVEVAVRETAGVNTVNITIEVRNVSGPVKARVE
jgi:uncharacterized alkaline shock family protein YloU